LKEIEAFSYSVSHDLRAPIRATDGYSRILLEDYDEKVDEEGRPALNMVSREAKRMGDLVDDLLAFSRLSRQPMVSSDVDMTALAKSVFESPAALERELTLRALPR
jgi:light-regulated signal transduction histidine kinase (bacteriophytochrome)